MNDEVRKLLMDDKDKIIETMEKRTKIKKEKQDEIINSFIKKCEKNTKIAYLNIYKGLLEAYHSKLFLDAEKIKKTTPCYFCDGDLEKFLNKDEFEEYQKVNSIIPSMINIRYYRYFNDQTQKIENIPIIIDELSKLLDGELDYSIYRDRIEIVAYFKELENIILEEPGTNTKKR